MKKIFILLLTLCLVLPLAACDLGKKSGTLTIAENGQTSYAVIYGQNSATGRDAAQIISNCLSEMCGAAFKPQIDTRASESATEILIGETNRSASEKAKAALPKEGDSFSISTSGKKIVIAASGDDALLRAAQYFASLYDTLGFAGDSTLLTVPASFSVQKSVHIPTAEPCDVLIAGADVTPTALSSFKLKDTDKFNRVRAGTSDGTNFFLAAADAAGQVKIVKCDNTGAFLAQSEVLPLGSAVSMCYNTLNGFLYVAHGGNEADAVSEIDSATLKLHRTYYLAAQVDGIAYRDSENAFLAHQKGSDIYRNFNYKWEAVGDGVTLPTPVGAEDFVDLLADSKNIYALFDSEDGPLLVTYNLTAGRYLPLPCPIAVTPSFFLIQNGDFYIGWVKSGTTLTKVAVDFTPEGTYTEPSEAFNGWNTGLNTDGLYATEYINVFQTARQALPSLPTRVAFQGGCTDGRYAYCCLEDQNNNYDDTSVHRTRIAKIDVITKKLIKLSEEMELDHSNDACYNSKTNQLIVVHNGNNRNRISYIDPETLEYIGSATMPCNIFSMQYNAARDRYIIGCSSWAHYAIVNPDTLTFEKRFRVAPSAEYCTTKITTQGVDCDDQYVYFVQWISSERRNQIIVYDWEGNYCFTKNLPEITIESENIWHIGKDFYIGCAANPDDRIYKVTLTSWLNIPK